jgi:esterase/lipase superfamily enzyme
VPVWFATDREPTGSREANQFFGRQRGTQLRYGVVEVTIPPGHERGIVERPVLWSIRRVEHPTFHVTMLRPQLQSPDDFYADLNQRLGKTRRKQAVIYVHGFSNSFADAARRTGQMAHDLRFQGVPLFYSWPSQESLPAYPADETIARTSAIRLSQFLDDALTRMAQTDVYLIAHSMGNLILTNAFVDLAQRRGDVKERIKELIMVAPDIDTTEFDQLADKLLAAGAGVTVYASRDDLALQMSRKYRSGLKRLGDLATGAFPRKGIDTIDATGIDTSFLGHAPFFMGDLTYLINTGLRAAQRDLDPVGEYFWAFKKPAQGRRPP